MAYRFRGAFAKSTILKDAVEEAQAFFMPIPQADSYIQDGETITADYIRESIRLLDNLDVYFADDLPEEIRGQAEKVLTRFGFCPWADGTRVIAHEGITPDTVISLNAYRRTRL